MNNLTIKKTRALLLLAYGAIFLWSFQTHGLPVARMAVLSWVAAAFVVGNVGQPKRKQLQMIGDLLFYAAMWLSYDYSRGTADSLGFPLQVELPRNIDKFLFIGHDPNVWIQEHFWHQQIRWYDVVGSLVYFTHFFVPVATSVFLWVRYRHEWVRYMRRFATVLFAGVLTYIVAPTVPPWMAASDKYEYQILEPLQRTTGRGWSWLGLETVSSVLLRGQQWANPTAALPSLHAAFALFVVIFFWRKFPRNAMRWTALSFPLAMAVTLVYFGEHYVTDILAGWAYVAGSFWFWNRWESNRAARVTTSLSVAEVSQ